MTLIKIVSREISQCATAGQRNSNIFKRKKNGIARKNIKTTYMLLSQRSD